MKVRRLNCPSCGAALNIEDTTRYGKCQYCNSCYVLDQGIMKVEYSFADEETTREIVNANVKLYKYKEYKQSLRMYISLFERYQDNKDFLLGIILSSTHQFTRDEYSRLEAKSILYYWDLFLKIGDNTDIEKYQNDIKKIQDQLAFKEKQRKKRKRRLTALLILCLIIFGVVSYFHYVAKPVQKDVKIRLSQFDGKVDSYIEHKLLRCDFDNKKIVDKKLQLTFECSNYTKKLQKYSYSYEVIDDEPPSIEVNNCEIEEGDKPDYSCVKVIDSIDGEITDYELDEREAKFKQAGETQVKIKAKDKSGNEVVSEITIKVNKIPITKFSITFNKDTYFVNEKPKATVTLEPDKITNRKVRFSVNDENIASIDKDGKLTFKNTGGINVCGFAQYNEEAYDCKLIKVYAQCQDSYVYDLDESSSTSLTANYDYCPGTYKIYAPSVLNKTDAYDIKIYSNSDNVLHDNTLIIWKSAEALNEEGKKVSLGGNSKIVIPSGIKQFKLVKVK